MTRALRVHGLLFLATVASVMLTAVAQDPALDAALSAAQQDATLTVWHTIVRAREAWVHGVMFTATLLGILLAHEFGHFFAAKYHKVDATLPYFIPLPLLSPFGTMGAVIRMKGVIPTRRALLDIGASGPLAGLCVAIPAYIWGIQHSLLVPRGGEGAELGESLLLQLMDRFAVSAAPAGMEYSLSPVAYAAWAGMFVTMINLLPVGQLDGGHVAYALFGQRQDTLARWVHRLALLVCAYVLLSALGADWRAGKGLSDFPHHVQNSLFWLMWFQLLGILGTLSRPAAARADRASSADDERSRELPAAETDTLSVTTRITMAVVIIVSTSFMEKMSTRFALALWFLTLGGYFFLEAKHGTLRRHTLFDHPPTGEEPLGVARKAVAVFTLLIFVLLFMLSPISQ